MNEFREQELIRLLDKLSEIQPSPEATGRALDGARRALRERPVLQLPPKWRFRPRRYVAAALLMIVCGASGWLLLRSPASASAGFVQVRNAMKVPTSLAYRQVVRVKGEPDVESRVMILHKGLWRAEKWDGSYTIMDVYQHRAIYVDPLAHQATNVQGINIGQNSLYEAITKLANNSSACALPDQKIHGIEVIGYTVTVGARHFTVWANAKTKMPVRIEVDGKDERGRNCEIFIDKFVFDPDLKPSWFDFWVPRSYKVTTEGIANFPMPAGDPRFEDFVVTPGVGLGPVKFGMPAAEVEKLLGKPDEVDEAKNGTVVMSYGSSLGFSLQVNLSKGVSAVSCVAQAAVKARVQDFSGQTDRGLSLGASAAEIVGLYGMPDSTEARFSSKYMVYDKLKARFTLIDDRLVQIWVDQVPTPK